MEAWRGFNKGVWCDGIDVSNFIKMNYTAYDGDSSFLEGPTERTQRTMDRVHELLIAENERAAYSMFARKEFFQFFLTTQAMLLIRIQTL